MLKEYKEDPEKFIRAKQANVNQTGGDVQVSAAPVLAFFPWLAGFIGVATAMLAQKHYNNSSASKQQYYRNEYAKENDDSDRDICREDYEEEYKRCYKRPKKFVSDCQERAAYRRRLCHRNGGVPDPEAPPEWGPNDEEVSPPRR